MPLLRNVCVCCTATICARQVTPPWRPSVSSATDTSNIAPEFTSEPAVITPSPAGFKLRDAIGEEEPAPSFGGFTFAQSSAMHDMRGDTRHYDSRGFESRAYDSRAYDSR